MKIRFSWILVSASLMPATATDAFAGGHHKTWKDTSDIGAAVLAISSLALPAANGDWQGLGEAAWSDGLAEGISLLGKSVVHEERPDHSDDHSFPSGHATLAFAAATTMYRRYGWEFGVPAYAVATLTGYARVVAKKHHWWDVVAGAGFGVGSGWLMTHPFDENVQMTPWVDGKAPASRSITSGDAKSFGCRYRNIASRARRRKKIHCSAHESSQSRASVADSDATSRGSREI